MAEYSDEEGQSLLLATFQVRNAFYGLDTTSVQEVILVGESTRVHHAPQYVRGIINLRGKIVTVIDLGCKLNDQAIQVGEDSRIIIVSWMGEQIGLLVDGVADVVSLDPASIEATPANVGHLQTRFLEGVYPDMGRLIGILNLDAVLAE